MADRIRMSQKISTVLLGLLLFAVASGGNDSLMTVTTESNDSPAADVSAFADYLYSRGEYTLAAHEYQRGSEQNSCEPMMFAAKALARAGKHETAVRRYEQVIDLCGHEPNLDRAARAGLVRLYILQEKFNLARFELNELRNLYTAASLSMDTLAYLEILIDAHTYRTDSAAQKIAAIAPSSPFAQQIRQLHELFTSYKKEEFKHPLEAYVFSTALPGAGQIYAGNHRLGIQAMTVMGLVGGLIVYSGYEFATGDTRQRYIAGMDIGVLSLLVWRRYYKGIQKTAFESAVFNNQQIQKKYQQKLKKIRGF